MTPSRARGRYTTSLYTSPSWNLGYPLEILGLQPSRSQPSGPLSLSALSHPPPSRPDNRTYIVQAAPAPSPPSVARRRIRVCVCGPPTHHHLMSAHRAVARTDTLPHYVTSSTPSVMPVYLHTQHYRWRMQAYWVSCWCTLPYRNRVCVAAWARSTPHNTQPPSCSCGIAQHINIAPSRICGITRSTAGGAVVCHTAPTHMPALSVAQRHPAILGT